MTLLRERGKARALSDGSGLHGCSSITTPNSNSRLVIFDKSLELERVFSDAYPEETCITIAPHQNTFSIISQKLANKTFDELHIVAHGSAGKIYLGDIFFVSMFSDLQIFFINLT